MEFSGLFSVLLMFGLIAFIVIALYKEIMSPALVFLIAVSILVTVGILTPREALLGFSNQNLGVVIMLLIISYVVRRAGILDFFFSRIFHSKLRFRGFLLRMMLFVSGTSAFMNNTPIVALMLPYVHEWGRDKRIPPSKLLIPLSYAAIFGGMATLIGTSTNLVVNSLAMDRGMPSFGIFDFTPVGVVLIAVGILYLYLFGVRLLPSYKDVIQRFTEKNREYLVETEILAHSPLIGRTVGESAEGRTKGLILVEIIRNGQTITPVSEREVLYEQDILIFAGATDRLTELLNQDLGLRLLEQDFIESQEALEIVEAVVPYHSTLINKRLGDTDFRSRFNAVIIAVHRNNDRVQDRLPDIVFRPGDVLLFLAGKDFMDRRKRFDEFYVISRVRDLPQVDIRKTIFLLAGLVSSVVLSALNLIPLFTALLIFITLMFLFRIVNLDDLQGSFELDLVLIIGFAFAIGKAMDNTGAADLFALNLIRIFEPLGPLGTLFGVYLITNILTEFITNTAAATISFPIAYATAITQGSDPVPYILAVAFAASASFITPIGYQTNLMVMGPGGYKFRDFFRVGMPLSLLMMVTCVFLLGLLYKMI